ncbi:MAG: hypothetical protein IPQ07_14510 [Myxococcales bacterium]|nr:hypothetical protein [Myxococcales bacterium]
MMLAPEPYLSACLEVLRQATIRARFIAYGGHQEGLTSEQADCLADLMDAVHNIPELLTRWEDCNEALLQGMLEDFDRKWQGHPSAQLVSAYLRIVAL